jgi:hypothetical protein
MLSKRRVGTRLLDVPWSEASLEKVDLLVVSQLTRLPDESELAAVLSWVKGGGTLLLMPTDDPVQRTWFRFFGERLGFALGEDLVESRSSLFKLGALGGFTGGAVERNTMPSPDNRVEHYASALPGLFDDVKYFALRGWPLTSEGRLETVLSYRGTPILAQAGFGEGRVIVCANDLLTNRYTIHPVYIEEHLDNHTVAERLTDWLVEPLPRFEVVWEPFDVNPRTPPRVARSRGFAFTIQGRGGAVDYSYPRVPHTVTVDGEPVEPRAFGLLERITVPAGRHRVEVRPLPKEK